MKLRTLGFSTNSAPTAPAWWLRSAHDAALHRWPCGARTFRSCRSGAGRSCRRSRPCETRGPQSWCCLVTNGLLARHAGTTRHSPRESRVSGGIGCTALATSGEQRLNARARRCASYPSEAEWCSKARAPLCPWAEQILGEVDEPSAHKAL